MASSNTALIGTLSELTAARVLHANGYEVSKPLGIEAYDLAARDPATGKFMRIQVKTGRIRTDRNNAMFINAKKSSGAPYTHSDCDYLCAVFGDDVYLIRNRGLTEYWGTADNVGTKWKRLSVDFDDLAATENKNDAEAV